MISKTSNVIAYFGATKEISTLIAVPYGEANQSILNTVSLHSVCQGNFVCNLMIPVDIGADKKGQEIIMDLLQTS